MSADKYNLMRRTRAIFRPFPLMAIFVLIFGGYWAYQKYTVNPNFTIGQEVDRFNGVAVFYNGRVDHVSGRNTAPDGYNLGLKYQCVEFVKRYYYEHLNHKMPDSYGHAIDFFDKSLADGQWNKRRNLLQFKNCSETQPRVDDLVIFDGSIWNRYGHVAIISKVTDTEIEIVQQNPGPFEKSRVAFPLLQRDGRWEIKNDRILGWLRKGE